MKTVTLVVEIVAEVPDDVRPEWLHLNNKWEDFRIEQACMPVQAKVKGYTTVNVLED